MTVTDDSKNDNESVNMSANSPTMSVQLPHTTDDLEKRAEQQISEYESTRGEGIIPRISGRDYLVEGSIGVLLILYLVVELFIV
jgi:hypothetical protein